MVPSVDVRFFNQNDEHRYTVEGVTAASVTTILEAEGLSGCAFWKEDDRKRGSAVHRIAALIGTSLIGDTARRSAEEIVARSKWDPEHTAPRLVGYGWAAANFYAGTGFRPDLVEKPVGSAKFQIAGTPDAWGYLPSGTRLLPDFKSGQPQEAAHVQTALYDMCLQETLGLQTDERYAVWLKPNGEFKIIPPKLPLTIYMNAGHCAVNLFRMRQQFKMIR